MESSLAAFFGTNKMWWQQYAHSVLTISAMQIFDSGSLN